VSKPRAMTGKPRKATPRREPIELLVQGAAQLTDLIRELGQLRDHSAATEQWLDEHGGDEARREISAIMVKAHGDKYSLVQEPTGEDSAESPTGPEAEPQTVDVPQALDGEGCTSEPG